MNSQQLFMELLHRLRGYSDASVLYALLQQNGDEKECGTSAAEISLKLGAGVSKRQVQRSFKRLADEGLIDMRTQPNYRTCIKVRREAVDALLQRISLSPNLPGMSTGSFPYIEHLAAAA